jgi:hypothetical protein
MIEEATALGAAAQLRIDAVKALQQRWQAEAQAVPLDRKQEQKLWDAFRKPIDEAFNRKGAERERAAGEMSARDRVVLDASKALEAANASGDAQQIRSAMQALEAALQQRAEAEKSEQNQVPSQEGQAPAATESEASAAPKAAPARPLRAVRGDDRPGMQREAAAASPRRDARPARGEGRGDGRGEGRFERAGRFGDRGPREERGPRLGDAAFRAQRDALDHAQLALKKLAAQAHGEALTQLLTAWEQRDAARLPSSQELGGRVTTPVRNSWVQALSAAPAGDAGEALLRLEMAADVPTPAEQLNARRALQLQMLTRRNDPAPAQTWGQDAARVLGAASDTASARRLQSALKALLRK